jgi:glycosyltransferase involved in cell wall biosynthesis
MSSTRLLLVTDAVGGVWIYSLELARALRELGMSVVLAVAGPSPSTAQREAADDVRLIETGLPLDWLESSSRDLERAAAELGRIAARERADIVQTHSAALLAGAALDCPSVAVQHSCVSTWWEAVKDGPLPHDFEWRRDLVEQGLRNADAVVAPTRAFAAATAAAYGLKEVIAVHNGRTARAVRELPPGNFVLTAARLWDEGKNTRTLDRAAARIGAPVQAAGPARGPNAVSAQFAHLHLLGELGERKLGGLLAARPIFASAALYEPFGLSVLEAAQAGCALVLSDIPTHRELWDGAAKFVDPHDDRGFAAAFEELLGDWSERRRLGEAAARAARRYSPTRMAQAMSDIYARIAQTQLVSGAA